VWSVGFRVSVSFRTVTESSTDQATSHTHPPTLTLILALDNVVGSHLDIDDYVIMFHIPLPAYVITIHHTDPPAIAHRPAAPACGRSLSRWVSGTFIDTKFWCQYYCDNVILIWKFIDYEDKTSIFGITVDLHMSNPKR